MNHCCPNALKESRSERVGLYRNEQGGFACLALLKITLGLHQCQRSHHRYLVYREGADTGNREGTTVDPSKVEAVTERKAPTSVGEIHSFLAGGCPLSIDVVPTLWSLTLM